MTEGSGLSPQPRIPRRAPAELWGAVPCWVCLQLEDGERARATSQLVAIVGAAAYAVCTRCGQEALDLISRIRHIGHAWIDMWGRSNPEVPSTARTRRSLSYRAATVAQW